MSRRSPASVPRKLIAASIAAVAALTLAACTTSASSSTTTPEASVPQEVVVAISAIPVAFALDAPNGVTGPALEIQTNTQGYLVRNKYVDGTEPGTYAQDLFDYEGELAESYDVSDDGLVYTFHLRPDVVSDNGNTLSADDVVWSWERRFNTATSISPGAQAPVIIDPTTQIRKIDDSTVSFTISRAGDGLTLLSLLGNITSQIYDSVFLKSVATPDDPYAVTYTITDGNFGYGAYRIASTDGTSEVVLEARKEWVYGEPKVKKVTYRVVEDPATRSNALKSGDVDIANNLRAVDQADLEADPNVQIFSVDFPNQIYQFAMEVNQPPFDDQKVRDAIQYAVPTEQIVDGVFKGRAAKADWLLDPAIPGYDGSAIPTYDYDPKAAKKALADAGYPDGVAFTLTYNAGNPQIADSAVQFQSFAADAGFDITLQELPVAAFTEGRQAHQFQSILTNYSSFTATPLFTMNLYFTENANNTTGWTSPEIQDLIGKAAQEDPTSDAAGEIWTEAAIVAEAGHAYAFIARVQPATGFGANIGGYAWRTDGAIDFSMISVE
jgi:peptide/nickel transport system substrate-binding protein